MKHHAGRANKTTKQADTRAEIMRPLWERFLGCDVSIQREVVEPRVIPHQARKAQTSCLEFRHFLLDLDFLVSELMWLSLPS